MGRENQFDSLDIFFSAFRVSALLPRRITGARKGAPQGKFWDGPAYTRIIGWGRHLEVVRAYFGKNRIEAIGFGGARLRIRQSGEPVVVIGDPKLMGVDPEEVDRLIRRSETR